MDRSILVRLVGFRAGFFHGDFLVYDRWRWLRKRLPKTRNGERLIDVGCGTGQFTIAAALRGYDAIGLSWDRRNQDVASRRASLCRAKAAFPIQDVRKLHEKNEFVGQFDIAVCFETIEHIMDDRKLVRDIHACLRPGGTLLLTAPRYLLRAITPEDNGPFRKVEDGGHLRRGYTPAMLRELCAQAGFAVEEISSCSGFFAQKCTWLLRKLRRGPVPLVWLALLPLRILPPLLDRLLARLTGWPDFTICLVAYKPRFPPEPQ